MSQFSLPWPDTSTPGPTIGDGRPYTDTEWSWVWRILFAQAQDASYCLAKGVWGELVASTPAANTIRVVSGAAVLYGHVYWSDATEDLAVNSAPAGNVRWDRLILRGTWSAGSNQYQVRLFIKEGTSAAPPSLTQVVNSTWEMSLYKYQVNDAGIISQITKEVQYLRFATEISTSMIAGGLDHGNLTGLADDDHTQYYNATRHTKAVHDALLIDADTLDSKHATYFVRNDDMSQSGTVTGTSDWMLPSPGVWSIVTFAGGGEDRISFNLAATCDVFIFFNAVLASAPGGTSDFKVTVDGIIDQEIWSQDGTWVGCHLLAGHWMFRALGSGAHYIQVKYRRTLSNGAVAMRTRKFTAFVIPRQT